MKPTVSFKKLTIRGKLLAVLSSLTIVISVLFFVISAVVTRVTLNNQIDHHVHLVALEAKRISENYTGLQRTDILRNLVSAQGMTIILLDADGTPIIQTNSPDVASVSEHQLQQITLESKQTSEVVNFTVDAIRFSSIPVELSSGQGTLAVGYSTKIIQQTLTVLSIALMGALAVVLLIVTIIVYWFTNRLFGPLEKVAQVTASVTNYNNLSSRISPLPSEPELRQIAATINNMLKRLENVFQTEHEFFADAAHTLKTPLAVLRSQIETSRLGNNKKEMMQQTIDQAAKTISQLILMSQLETQSVEKVKLPLHFLMNQISELAATLAMKDQVKLTNDFGPQVWIYGDSSLLSRALANVVNNAVEHTPSGSEIVLSYKLIGTQVKIIVANEGSTLSPDDAKRVFDRFFRGANSQHSGTGLGLAITKTIIEKHNGTIKVTSNQHQTKFIITLPIATQS